MAGLSSLCVAVLFLMACQMRLTSGTPLPPPGKIIPKTIVFIAVCISFRLAATTVVAENSITFQMMQQNLVYPIQWCLDSFPVKAAVARICG